MNFEKGEYKFSETIGIIPAAGFANRISPLPCSKEIYPIGCSNSSGPKAAATYLIECFELAGIEQSNFIIRNGKWDIPEYYREGSEFNMNLAYIVTGPTEGTPFTIDKAYPFVRDHCVAFGFPDILIRPQNAFVNLIEKLKSTDADIVLGLFPADNPSKVDMVKLDEEGRIQDIIIKPEKTDLKYTWLISVWSPVFMNFHHTFISGFEGLKTESTTNFANTDKDELYMGDIIIEAICSGLNVETVTFTKGSYIDIGTIEDLKKAIKTEFLQVNTD